MDDLKVEIARLTAALAQARQESRQHWIEVSQAAAAHDTALTISRAETTDSRRENSDLKGAALDAENRHHSEIEASASTLAVAEDLLAELRASETARVAAERQQQVLNQELSHRLKNTLALVQAIASQTLKGVADQGSVRAFHDRLLTLSTAHDVLLQQSWAPAPMREIVDKVLSLHGKAEALCVAGPNLRLSSRAALSLSLLLHELATNAAKYGAWSAQAGVVDLTWSTVSGSDGASELSMTLQERGGPPARAPSKRSFGSRLIGMGFGTGRASTSWQEAGFRGEFQAPLLQLIDVSPLGHP